MNNNSIDINIKEYAGYLLIYITSKLYIIGYANEKFKYQLIGNGLSFLETPQIMYISYGFEFIISNLLILTHIIVYDIFLLLIIATTLNYLKIIYIKILSITAFIVFFISISFSFNYFLIRYHTIKNFNTNMENGFQMFNTTYVVFSKDKVSNSHYGERFYGHIGMESDLEKGCFRLLVHRPGGVVLFRPRQISNKKSNKHLDEFHRLPWIFVPSSEIKFMAVTTRTDLCE